MKQLVDPIAHMVQIDDFDGEDIFFIIIFPAFVDMAAVAAADNIVEIIAIFPNPFLAVALGF